MTSDEYRNVYLRSEHWMSVRARFTGRPCVCCAATLGIELHHVTYCRLGEELDSDLRPLCGECHQWVHDQIGYKGKLSHTDRHIERRRREFGLPGDMKRAAEPRERPAKPYQVKRKRFGQSRFDRNPLWFMNVPGPGERVDPAPPPQGKSPKKTKKTKKKRPWGGGPKKSPTALELEAYRRSRQVDPVAAIVAQAMRPRR